MVKSLRDRSKEMVGKLDSSPLRTRKWQTSLRRLESLSGIKYDHHSFIKYKSNRQALFHYGCQHCEWRGLKNLCPRFDKSLDPDLYDVKNSICDVRIHFLLSIYSKDFVRSFDLNQLHRDYLKYTNTLLYKKDLGRLLSLDAEIISKQSELDTEPDLVVSDTLKELKDEYDVIFKRLCNLGIELDKLDKKDLDRESREKVAKDVGLGLSDIHRIMSGESIDAEYEESK